MKFFRLDSSLRNEGSVSRRLADAVEQQWLHQHPSATIVRRDVGAQPLPPLWPAAVSVMMSPPDQQQTPDQLAAVRLAAELVDELFEADAYLFAVPIYNWGVPQQLKHWIDMVITDSRMGAAVERPIAGRPAVLVEARGGGYSPGTPREGWDHVSPYLNHILGDLWASTSRSPAPSSPSPTSPRPWRICATRPRSKWSTPSSRRRRTAPRLPASSAPRPDRRHRADLFPLGRVQTR